MDRATVYTQEQARSTDFLFAQRAAMIGLAKLSSTVLGANTIVRGLAVTANSPAALNVLVGIGEIYSVAAVDATAWGALPADTTDMILKQGLNMAAQTVSTPAPTTGGYSINYLIEVQYQDQDTTPVVLPFFNSANPSQPLNGQNNSGAAQPTERQGVCVVQAKAGIAAATGTQTTPSADSGWTGLAVVTVAYGQTTVIAGNISIPAGVPQVTNILQMLQTGSTLYAIDTSTTPNQIALALTPPITAYQDGQPIRFQAANTNTSGVTLNAGPGSITLSGAAGALQGGEIVAGKFYEVVYKSNTGTAVLVGQGGGALQVATGTASNQASTVGQIQAGTLGSAVAGGTANALTATIPSTLTTLTNGQPFTLIASAANTGAAAAVITLGTTALASKPIVKGNNQALVAGDIPSAGYPIELNYSSTYGAYVMQNPATGITSFTPTQVQASAFNTANDTGAANAYVAAFSPALSAPVAGAPFWIKIANANTGASTLNTTGTVYPLLGGAHLALQGGELVANGWALIDWNATLTSYVLLYCTGAAAQVSAALHSNQAVNLGQILAPIIADATGTATNTTTTITVAFTTTGPGSLLAIGNCNFTVTSGANNTSTLSINGSPVSSDATQISKALVGSAPCAAGSQNASLVCGSSSSSSLWLTLVFIPNV